MTPVEKFEESGRYFRTSLMLPCLILTWLLDHFYPLNTGHTTMALPFLIPLIIAAVGAGASYLKARAQGQSVDQQNQLYNEWLANRQNGVNDIIEKLTAGGFDPFGAQTTTQNSTGKSNSTTVSSGTTSSHTQPFITPDFKPLVDAARGVAENRLARPTGLPPGYAATAVEGINKAYAGADTAARNAAAAKGLSGEQTFGIVSPAETARAGDIAKFTSNLPLVERDLQNQDVALASGLSSAFGLGSDTTGKTSGVSTTAGTTSNSGSISAPPNIGALAGLLLPPGPNSPYANPYGSIAGQVGQVGGDLAGIIMQLWAKGAFKGSGSAPSDPGD